MAQRLYRPIILKNFVHKISAGILLTISLSAAAHLDVSLPDTSSAVPNLSWKAEPFKAFIDNNARYIDFKSGSDTNSGSQSSPWKHHPWDKNATANAAQAKNINTYYFKKGVVYHGSLIANQSGTSQKPIRLSIDENWGSGEAVLSGSYSINSKWHICKPSENKQLPKTSQNITWCTDTNLRKAPSGLWATLPSKGFSSITLARMPNWNRRIANDPRHDWNTLDQVLIEQSIPLKSSSGFRVGDTVHLKSSPSTVGEIVKIKTNAIVVQLTRKNVKKFQRAKVISNGNQEHKVIKKSKPEPTSFLFFDKKNLVVSKDKAFDGATLWVEPKRLPIPIATSVRHHDTADGKLSVKLGMSAISAPIASSRYYLEGLPQFLDVDGEYAYQKLSKKKLRLFLRLPNDVDPNDLSIEVANKEQLLLIKNQHHIEISGLTLRSNNQILPGSDKALTAAMFSSAIQIRGSCSHINIHHNDFYNLSTGIVAYPLEKSPKNIIDYISINDNTFSHISGSAITMGNGQRRKPFAKQSSRLINVDIARNTLHDIGLRSLGRRGVIGVGGDGILVNGGEVVEIAYNHVNYSGGPGIHLVLGAEYGRGKVSRPFLRGLIHHNKVENTLLTSYDFGGISAWTGGPVYIYNNISINPVGYRPTSPYTDASLNTIQRSSYGIGIYLDGVYKGYVFNNIVWGNSNDLTQPIYNAVAFNEARGFMHTVFHNTFYKFAVGLHRGGGIQHNRNYYLANIVIDMKHKFIQHKSKIKEIEFDSIAYGKNIFKGDPISFGQIGKGRRDLMDMSFDDWQSFLEKNDALISNTGEITKKQIVKSSNKHDFRLITNSPAINNGVQVFIPWSLSRVVGEWHFYQNKKFPQKVMGENINMNSEWVQRPMFHQIPRNNLSCPQTTANDYTDGTLENWVTGSLNFNGQTQSCSLAHTSLIDGYEWQEKTHKKMFKGKVKASERDTVNIKTESFIIESVINTQSTDTGGIVSKRNKNGYEMFINKDGQLAITLDFGNSSITQNSKQAINDGKWHHLLVEVDRSKRNAISIYIDGKIANGRSHGSILKNGDLSNNADFIVGHSPQAGYFKGKVDFLRVAKSTLEESKTTIQALYEWEFDGPQLKDFSGNSSNGKRNNAGAVETVIAQ